MQPRHAAPLALVVWYLMIPPTRERPAPVEIFDHAPLREWQIGEQDASKTECESTLKEFKRHAEHITLTFDPVTVEQVSRGRCMASDDPD